MGVRCVEDDADAIDESFNGGKYSEYHEKYEGEARRVVSAPSSSSLNLSLSIGQVSCKPNSVKPKTSISRRRKRVTGVSLWQERGKIRKPDECEREE